MHHWISNVFTFKVLIQQLLNFHKHNISVLETNKLVLSVAAMTISKAKLDINVILIIYFGLKSV